MQRASAVLDVPLAVVDDHLRPVVSWPAFLPGLEDATATSFARYRFRVRHDGRAEDVPVAVAIDHRRHCVSWHALHGPRYEGRITLEPAGDRRTRVTVELTVDPRTTAGHWSSMVGGRGNLAWNAMHKLADACTAEVRGGQA